MPEPTAFPEEHISEPLAYRRLSAMAVASVALGGSFAIYLVFAGLVGLRERTPLLLVAPVQAIPVLGFALAMISLLLINKSDGTLAGRSLANWGLWLSVVFGLGYWAYYGATYFAVRQQSDVFVTEWLNKLAKGRISSAFVDCQAPGMRSRINPEDEETININFKLFFGPQASQKGLPLDIFKENELIRIFIQGLEETKVEPKGIQEWDFENQSYRVSRIYEITTEEGKWDVQITSRGMESPNREYEGRQWIIVWSESKVLSHQLSAVGLRIQDLKGVAGQIAADWISRLSNDNLVGAYWQTRGTSSSEANAQAAAGFARLLSAGLGGAPIQGNAVMPGQISTALSFFNLLVAQEALRRSTYTLFERDQIMKSEKLKANDESTRKIALDGMQKFLGAAKEGQEFRGVKYDNKSMRRPWRKKGNAVILPVDCRFGLGGRAEDPRFSVETTIFVEVGAPESGGKIDFRIVGIELIEARDRAKENQMPMETPPQKPSRPEMGAPPTPIPNPGTN
jgi:hypothetical protein